jgi:hypothetical protein
VTPARAPAVHPLIPKISAVDAVAKWALTALLALTPPACSCWVSSGGSALADVADTPPNTLDASHRAPRWVSHLGALVCGLGRVQVEHEHEDAYEDEDEDRLAQ